MLGLSNAQLQGLAVDGAAMGAATYALTGLSGAQQLIVLGLHAGLNVAAEKQSTHNMNMALKVADLLYVPTAAVFFGEDLTTAGILLGVHLATHYVEESLIKSAKSK